MSGGRGRGACQGVPSNIFCDFGAQRAENDDSSTFRLQNFRMLDGFLTCLAEQGSLWGGDVATHATGAPQGLMEKKAFFACKGAKDRKREKATEATIVP